MCHEVKVKGLWKHGGYKDWSHWVLAAAPVCAKTVFVYVALYENLTPDFSHEELLEMPPETAKKMTQVSTACRKDPVVFLARSETDTWLLHWASCISGRKSHGRWRCWQTRLGSRARDLLRVSRSWSGSRRLDTSLAFGCSEPRCSCAKERP